ncbi:MAG: hypothetical protein AB1500_02930 [Bacillota bacterium]
MLKNVQNRYAPRSTRKEGSKRAGSGGRLGFFGWPGFGLKPGSSGKEASGRPVFGRPFPGSGRPGAPGAGDVGPRIDRLNYLLELLLRNFFGITVDEKTGEAAKKKRRNG